MTTPATVASVLGQARERLRAAGVEGAALDARVIVAGLLGLDLTALVTAGDRPVAEPDRAAVQAAVARRIAGEPPGRILGRREFHGHLFELGPDTLEPRADTEALVDAALALVRAGGVPGAGPDGEGLRFADLGTGTGAIAVALAAALPRATSVAVDLSAGAAEVARRNAEAIGVSGRLTVVQGSWCEPLEGVFGLILSNPPYIASADLADLDREVREHDPALALDGGPDGLSAYRAILGAAPGRLLPGGTLAVEIGWKQGRDVMALFGASGLTNVRCLPDLAGRDRVVAAARPR